MNNLDFQPIKLPKVKTEPILDSGYYDTIITKAEYKCNDNGKKYIRVRFSIEHNTHGEVNVYKNFYITTEGSINFLSFFCGLCGIRGELNSTEELIGRRISIEVEPESYNDREFNQVKDFRAV